MAVIGLDIGTSGCKCTIFHDNGKVSSHEYKSYQLILSQKGWMELDPNVVWEAVLTVLKFTVLRHRGSEIRGVCISSFGEAGVLINKNGEVLYNSILYADPRGEEQCKHLIEKMSPWEITKRSGHNPALMYSALKLMWLKDNYPEILNASYKFLQYSGFILYKLCGEIREDYSLCSRTMLFNVVEKKWDDKLLNSTGLEHDLFPDVIKTGEIAGKITLNMAEETGLSKNTVVILGGHDQITAAVGGGVIKNGMAMNGMGSVDCITPIFNNVNINRYMQKYSYACVPFVFDDFYVTYAFNYAGGSLLSWYKKNFGRGNYDKNSKSNCDPSGILVLPHIMGAATPYMDTKSTGAILGLSVNTDNNTLYQAMMEGVAFENKVNIDCLCESGVEIERLTACGGGSRSRDFLQIKANILNIPIDILEFEEAGTLGAGIMAGTACGLYENIKDGVDQWVNIIDTIYPDGQKHAKYMQLYSKYKKMYTGLKSIMSD